MCYVVIFKAQIQNLDESYFQMAQQLRQRALTEFNCQHFEALSEEKSEIALSYWNNLTDIQAWYADSEHQVAQARGKQQWYSNFEVEICEVLRRYTTIN